MKMFGGRESRTVSHHTCPHCGAGLSRLRLRQGGFVGKLAKDLRVKALVECRECLRAHKIQGSTRYERELILHLIQSPRLNGAAKVLP
jgi:hypothetical protein